MNGLKKHIYVESPKTSITAENNYLIFQGETNSQICLDDVDSLFLNETSITISIRAINKCIENNVSVITLDKRHNPCSQLIPINFTHNCKDTISKQIKWTSNKKTVLISKILINKFKMQSSCLIINKLNDVVSQFNYLDKPTLLEGAIAKQYFKVLFGSDFNRNDDNYINSKLNYGYSIFVSHINKIIVSHGYLTSLGIYHCSKCNNFNLTYDLFEPFRPIVDTYVYKTLSDEFDFKYKTKLTKILDIEVYINNKKYQLRDGIEKYVINCINYLNNKTNHYEDVSFNG